MAQQPVNGSKVPIPELGFGLSLAAGYLKTAGGDVRTAGADIKTIWSGLSGVYKAPESADLLAVMDPVATTTNSFATDVETVAAILDTFAAEAEPLVQTLINAQGEANAFDAKVRNDDKWDHDGGKVSENNRILHTVDTTLAAYQAAERKAANAIEKLIGGHTWHAADPNATKPDPYAYGYASIPDNAKTPWGAKVTKKDGCLKSTLTHVGHFFQGAGGALWGMVTGMGDLIGLGGWDKFKASWQGLNTIVQLIDVPAGIANYGWNGYLDRLTTVGKGLIDYNQWKTDPAKAFGNSLVSIGTFAIPVAGWVAKGSAAAKAASVAGDASKVGDIADATGNAGRLAKAGELTKTAVTNFGKYTDPFYYAGRLPKLIEITTGTKIKLPGLLTPGSKDGSVLNNEINTLDHTPAHVSEPVAVGGGHTGEPAFTGTHSPTVDHPPTSTGHAGSGDHGPNAGSGDHSPSTSGPGAGHSQDGSGGGGDHSSAGNGAPAHPHVNHTVNVTHETPTKAFAAKTDLEPNTAYHVQGRGTFYTDHTGRVTYVETAAGKTGALNGDLLHPQPNVTYVVDGRHIYHTDHLARTDHVHVDELQRADADRSTSVQGRVGRDGGDGYEGGHLVANVFGGGPEDHNLVAMLREVNRGKGDSFGNLEKSWLAKLKADPSTKITVDIRPQYIGDSTTPSRVVVRYSVDGGPVTRRVFQNV